MAKTIMLALQVTTFLALAGVAIALAAPSSSCEHRVATCWSSSVLHELNHSVIKMPGDKKECCPLM
jgi:hypothetical protein